MDIIQALKNSKQGDVASVEFIIDQYKNYIYYEMAKYHIQDKITCYEEVRSNIIKAILLFEIQ